MLFWIGILVGGFFAYFAYKLGFYETWAMLFNIIIAIYVAVFFRPVIAQIIPAADETQYGHALTMLTTAIAVFLILHGISYTFLTAQFTIVFPKILNTLGTSLLGMLAGFLVWSFAMLLLCTTPISQNSFVRELGFDTQFQQTNTPYMSWWCNLVNSAISSEENRQTTEQIVDELLKSAKKKPPTKTTEQPEPNNLETTISEPPACEKEDLQPSG